MPKIRQSTAQPIGNTGSTGPVANPTGAAPGFGALASGTRSLVGGLGAMAGAKKAKEAAGASISRDLAIDAKNKYDADQKLRTDDVQTHQNAFKNDWMKDNSGEGLSQEDAAEALFKRTEELITENDLGKEAAKFVRYSAKRQAVSFMQEFSVNEENYRVEEASVRLDATLNNAIKLAYADGNYEALIELSANLKDRANELFPKLPKRIAAHYEGIDTNVAETIIELDPEAGKAFVNQSPHISSSNRLKLLRNVGAFQKSNNALAVSNLQKTIIANKQNVFEGGKHVRLGKEAFSVLGDNGESAREVYENDMLVLNDAANTYNFNRGSSQQTIEGLRQEYRNAEGNKRESLGIVLEKLDADSKIMRTDPASYVQSGSPAMIAKAREVDRLEQAFSEASDENKGAVGAELKAAKNELNSLTLDLQGPGDTQYHINLPKHLRSILPNPEAKALKDHIEGSEPIQILDAYNKLFVEYPDPQDRAQAFKDITEQGLAFPYVMAYGLKDEAFVETFLKAVQTVGKSETDADKNNVSSLIEERADYQIWKEANNDGGSNKEFVDSGLTAITKYAKFLQSERGYKLDDAVDLAIANTFKGMVFIESGGSGVLMFSAHDEDGVPFTEFDQDTFTDFLDEAIYRLDLDQVGDMNFVDSLGVFRPEDKKKYVRDVMVHGRNLRFQTDNDGKSGILIGEKTDGGDEFVVLDKNGDPFRIHMNDLPRRINKVWQHSLRAGRYGAPETRSNWPFAKYPRPKDPGYYRGAAGLGI